MRSSRLAKYVSRVAAALALCSFAAPSAAQDQALYAKVREHSAQANQKLAEAKRLNISDPAGSCAAYTEADKLLGQAITQFTAFRLTYPNGPKDQMDGGMAQMVNAQRMAQSEAKGICSSTVAMKPKPATDAPLSKVNADTSREGKAKLACEADKDFDACTTYGVALMKGTPTVPQNKGNAVAYFRFACTGGNALGCRNLGQAQAGGVGTMTDMAAAVISFGKACKGGDNDSCIFEYSAQDKIEASVAAAFKSDKIDAAIASQTQLALKQGYKLLSTSPMLRGQNLSDASSPQNFAIADYLIFAVCDEACTDVRLTVEHSLGAFAGEKYDAPPATQRLVAFRPSRAESGNVKVKVRGCSEAQCYARFVIYQRPSPTSGGTAK